MASSLSDDEFNRMQIQLLELRTQNYQLDDRCKRQTRDLQSLTEKVDQLEKSLERANKTITKSKKAKEFDLLIQENDQLQRKILSQEEDFHLQNTTLMQELNTLVSSNEELEKQLRSSRDGGVAVEKHDQNEASDDIRRLQAENMALQKNVAVQQDKFEEERMRFKETIQLLKDINSDLENQCSKLAGRRGTPAGDENAECRTVEGQDDPAVATDTVDGVPPIEEDDSSPRLRNASFTELMNLVTKSENNNEDLQQQMKELNDLRLKLDTEVEEKKMLKDQLNTLEKSSKDQINTLQTDVEKLTEKLRKKQESYVKLQEEKEKLYKETSEKFDELQTRKDREISQLMEQNTRMQAEVITANQAVEDYKERLGQKISEMDLVVSTLTDQVDASSQENNQQLQEQITRFQQQIEELDGNLAKVTHDLEDTRLQLKECQHASSITLEQLHEAQRERDKQIQALQEITKVAEKRKSLLDELAIKYQKECDDHREIVKVTESRHRKELDDLCDLLDQEKAKTQDYGKMKVKHDEIVTQVQSLEEAKGWLERRLDEAEENMKEKVCGYEKDIETLKAAHTEEFEAQGTEHKRQIEELEKQMTQLKEVLDGKEVEITNLHQEIKDGVDERKIHEKKGASLMKDLKHQLRGERKRAEKLQERLQELLSDTKSRQSMEELFRPIDPNDRYRGDNSSISSWSASGLGRDNTPSLQSPQSNHDMSFGATSPIKEDSPPRTPPSVLEQENNDLLARIGELQQEKWMYEEKLAHLEASTAAMAEDLLTKTAIIDHYVMNSRTDLIPQSPSSEKLTFKRVMDFVKDKGDENMREVNRKLQRVLEETLTKNMHLQKDMDSLSEELVKLSKVHPTSTPISSPSKP
ncbi:GRIP1-associated protein 1-like isoform X2 [Lineus longissimus]|uniref:GRIP1-associated protein 1-like isoform X2 n=1 Tax=Lineus longissimus TaxID=88925 RepID=UPI002B4F8CAA